MRKAGSPHLSAAAQLAELGWFVRGSSVCLSVQTSRVPLRPRPATPMTRWCSPGPAFGMRSPKSWRRCLARGRRSLRCKTTSACCSAPWRLANPCPDAKSSPCAGAARRSRRAPSLSASRPSWRPPPSPIPPANHQRIARIPPAFRQRIASVLPAYRQRIASKTAISISWRPQYRQRIASVSPGYRQRIARIPPANRQRIASVPPVRPPPIPIPPAFRQRIASKTAIPTTWRPKYRQRSASVPPLTRARARPRPCPPLLLL